MKGKWAQGIVPRHFAWIIKDQLAVCERPGGYGENHRKVRRQEEIIWIREQGFAKVISLIPSTHNLHAYDELGVVWEHVAFGPEDDAESVLRRVYRLISEITASGAKVIVHQDDLADNVSGVVGGYLVWSGLVPEEPRAVAMVEKLLARQLGPRARELVALSSRLAQGR